MSFSLSQPQMLDLLAVLHPGDSSRPTALRGRFQTFQRYGLPRGTRTGRGRVARYGPSELVQILIGFELLELGLAPERIARLVTQANFLPFVTGYGLAGPDTQPIVAMVRPRALSPDTVREGAGLTFSRRDLLLDLLSQPEAVDTSFALINVTQILRGAAAYLDKIGVIPSADFDTGLRGWVVSMKDWRDGIDPQA